MTLQASIRYPFGETLEKNRILVPVKIPSAVWATAQDLRDIFKAEKVGELFELALQLFEALFPLVGLTGKWEFQLICNGPYAIVLNLERSAEVYERSLRYEAVDWYFDSQMLARTRAMMSSAGIHTPDEFFCLAIDVLAQFVHAAKKNRSWCIGVRVPRSIFNQLARPTITKYKGEWCIQFGPPMETWYFDLMPEGADPP